MIVAALETRQTAQVRGGMRDSRRAVYAPLFIPRALAAGSVRQDGDGYSLAPRFALPGVSVSNDGNGSHSLRFDSGVWDRELAEVIALHVAGAELAAGPGGQDVTPEAYAAPADVPLAADLEDGWEDGQPTDEDLKLIRRNHSLDPSVKREDLFVFTRWVANDALSRGGWLRLTPAALEKGAEDLAAGRAVCLHHDKRNVFGRTFSSRVVRRKREGLSARWIEVRGYAHRRASNQDTIDDVRLGILAADSVTFTGGDVSLIEESVQTSGSKSPKVKRSFLQVDHDPESPSPFRIVETSFVFLGELHGAGNAKLSAGTPTIPPPSGTDGTSGAGNTEGESASVIFLP